MQYGMLNLVGPENITWGADGPTGRGTFGVSDRLKNIVKHKIWGWVRMGCGPILTIYTSCDAFVQGVAF